MSTTDSNLTILAKIFEKILQNPKNVKYRDINCQRIQQKFNNSSTSLQWLINAGFHKSDDDKRFLLNDSKLNQLNKTYKILLEVLITENYTNIPQKEMKRIKQTLLTYEANKTMDDVNVQQIVDDYIHIMHLINNDEDKFELVYNYLANHCDITTCCIIKRRNAKVENRKYKNNVRQDVMDKIHCFFMHSYDMGYRLTQKQKFVMINHDEEKKHDNLTLMNSNIHELHKLIHTKQRNIGSKHRNYKFNQLFENNIQNMKQYKFGTAFKYKYNEIEKRCLENRKYIDREDAVCVEYKFSNIKKELLSNKFCCVTVEQFNNEYSKASLYFNSCYCKSLYRPCATKEVQIGYMELEHILALLFYCNYDALSYEFSKTYRENIQNHAHFYHLG
eukprot:208060_1